MSADGASPAGPSVPAREVRELVRRIHSTASQEAAAARIAIALWRRATARGDATMAATAAGEAEARLEALFDALADLETSGTALLAAASEGRAPGT